MAERVRKQCGVCHPGRSVITTSGGTALRLRFGPVWVTRSVRTCQPRASGLAGANLRSHRPRCSGRIVHAVALIEDRSINAADAGCPGMPGSSAWCLSPLRRRRAPTHICCSRRPFAREMRVFSRPRQDNRILSPVLVTAQCDVAEGLTSFQQFSRRAVHQRPRIRLV